MDEKLWNPLLNGGSSYMTSCLMMHAWERKDERLCLVNADSKMNPKLENLHTVGYE
jgi:hypothetical protein